MEKSSYVITNCPLYRFATLNKVVARSGFTVIPMEIAFAISRSSRDVLMVL